MLETFQCCVHLSFELHKLFHFIGRRRFKNISNTWTIILNLCIDFYMGIIYKMKDLQFLVKRSLCTSAQKISQSHVNYDHMYMQDLKEKFSRLHKSILKYDQQFQWDIVYLLFAVLHGQEYFPPLPVNGCKIWAKIILQQ